jgi:hypothetical protein
VAPIVVADTIVNLDTLHPSTTYEWYARAFCAEGDTSAWAGPHTFDTDCGIPDSLMAYGITDNLATLKWDETGMATQWPLMLGCTPFDSLGVEPIDVLDTIIGLDSLAPSTSYEWYVRADCGEGDFSNWAGPASFFVPGQVLPFYEDWETQSGVRKTNGLIYSGNSYLWSFKTDHQDIGRVRWGSNTHQSYQGVGALTMDGRFPGETTTNFAILSIDLSAYVSSQNLELSFWWTDHGDEEYPNNKTWIRGSDTDEWIEFYDFDPSSAPDNIYQLVEQLDIDQVLADATPTQTVSNSFQIRFGQEDTGTTPFDGISIDDITVEEIQISANESQVSIFDVTKDYSEIKVHANNGFIYIKSFGKAIEQTKEIVIYDIFGRKIVQTKIGPASMNKIAVESCSCYHFVRLFYNNQMKSFKVFVK